MAVTTTKTNKPILPRGVDNRPVDSYNRAELYSGKALDFDGVNDYVDLDGFTMAGNVATIVFYGKFTNDGRILDLNPNRFIIENTASGLRVYNNTSYTIYGTTDRDKVGFYAIVSDGTTQRAYYNGHQLGSDATITALDWDSVTNMKLGAYFGGGSVFLDGQLSGFKIFNTALTAAQVADLYNNPEKVVPTGVDNTALKLWLPMQEGAGTTAINGAPDALGSEEVTNGDFSDGSNDWSFGSGFSVVNGKAYYNDSASGNQIYQSNLTFDTSKNYILTFDISDATDAQLWVGNGAGTNAYTINANYNNYNNGHYSLLLRGSDIGASETTLGFWANPSGSVFSIDNISLKEVANCGTISGATWTHGIGAPVAQTSVIDWNKWKLEGGSTTNEYLIPQGLTSGRDLLGNLFENVRKQGALNLDGNSWAEVHDNASLDFGTGSFTLEAWVKADFLSQGSGVNIILSLGGDITSANNSGLVSTSSAFSFWIGGINRFTPAYVSESWNHIVGVRSGSSVIFYFNGAQVATGSSSSSITNSQEKQIGRDETTIRYYPNQIAQPRIYNRALTASEVLNNYNATSSLYI